MLELRDLKFLSALARHRHFARAADECGVSQPAFSMRIRKLEERLDMPIVKRGNRFQGLTEEGEAIVRHAREILEEVRSLEEIIRATKSDISGPLRLGTIPTAVAAAARLASDLHALHPRVRVRVETTTAQAIGKRLEDGSVDAGLTYGDAARGETQVIDRLYDERYVLLAPAAMAPRQSGVVTWEEAADLPLCLLEPGMQNRRIIDRMFWEIDRKPELVAETDELGSAMLTAAHGLGATILPEVLVADLGPPAGTIALPLVEPTLEHSIVLVTQSRGTQLPAVEALRRCAVLAFDKR